MLLGRSGCRRRNAERHQFASHPWGQLERRVQMRSVWGRRDLGVRRWCSGEVAVVEVSWAALSWIERVAALGVVASWSGETGTAAVPSFAGLDVGISGAFLGAYSEPCSGLAAVALE